MTTPLSHTCHCGRTVVTYPAKPTLLNECQCSACFKYGTIWAYYPADTVSVSTCDGAKLDTYVRSDEMSIGNVTWDRCSHCGCVVTWTGIKGGEGDFVKKMRGVNYRLAGWREMQGIEREYQRKDDEWPNVRK